MTDDEIQRREAALIGVQRALAHLGEPVAMAQAQAAVLSIAAEGDLDAYVSACATTAYRVFERSALRMALARLAEAREEHAIEVNILDALKTPETGIRH